MRLSPKSIYESTKKRIKGKSLVELGQWAAGTAGIHATVRQYREGKKEEAAEDLVATEEAEKAVIQKEKLATAKTKLEAQRKKRRGSAARKGRRASIMSGPLGAGAEPEVRRAGVLGA